MLEPIFQSEMLSRSEGVAGFKYQILLLQFQYQNLHGFSFLFRKSIVGSFLRMWVKYEPPITNPPPTATHKNAKYGCLACLNKLPSPFILLLVDCIGSF